MDPTGCPPDDDAAAVRVNYFDGILLTALDFEQEQAYNLAKARRHNRFLHGWGVVSGLDVTVSGSTGRQVSVTPGYAIDLCGREISIWDDVIVDVPTTDGSWVLAVRYEECAVSDRRTRDSFRVDILSELTESWIVLAAITVGDDQGVSIDTSVRRPLSRD